MGPVDQLAQPRQHIGLHSQAVQRDAPGVLVQNTDDHVLAVQRRIGGDAEVVLTLRRQQCQTAILGRAALRDVHRGHDLEARHERELQILGHQHGFLQKPVHTEADTHAMALRLDMDITGPMDDGARDDGVDQANDRRALAHLLELVERELGFRRGLLVAHLHFIRVDAAHRLADQLTQIVVGPERAEDGLLDVLLGGDDRVYLQTGVRLKLVDGRNIERIDHRDRDCRRAALDRHGGQTQRQAVGNQARDRGVQLTPRQVREGNAVLLADAAGLVLLGQDAQAHEQVADRLGGAFALTEDAGDLEGRG